MSYTWADAAYDEAMDSLYDEFAKTAHEDGRVYDRVIAEFKDSRLRAFYVAHPDISDAAHNMLAEADKLNSVSPRCSLVFSAATSEICLRDVLLKPIIYGCFHSESSGELISTLIADAKHHQFLKASLDIFTQCTGIDLRKYQRPRIAKVLWQEISEIQQLRNQVLHGGKNVSEKEAVQAVQVSSCLLTFIFPHTMTKLGLHLHKAKVCNTTECFSDRDQY